MFSRAIHTIRLAASAAYKEPLATEYFEPIIIAFAANQMRRSGKTLEEEAAVAEVQAGMHWSPYEDPTEIDAHLTVKFIDSDDNHITTRHVPIRGTKRSKRT